MMRKVRPDDWSPAAGIVLEANALAAVRSDQNSLVVAGPGAGKTELLAQRACYLLETGLCLPPRRILAISFKRDAAQNLGERVENRCGRDLSVRFDSKTYDAFAKRLVDQFGRALPGRYRPSRDYEIVSIGRTELAEAISSFDIPRALAPRGASSIQLDRVMREYCLTPLPVSEDDARDAEHWVGSQLWTWLLTRTPSKLTFPMIGRLAELILRTNPSVLHGLRATYSHVFLDEFQDTTGVQYDLVNTAFHGSNSILTAVGDHKQRIMGWAGALPKAFEQYTADFGAVRLELMMNHRSAPRLVEIQRVLALQLDPESVAAEAAEKWDPNDGLCEVLVFTNYQQEAQVLSEMIRKWVHEEKVPPRQICILAKQRVHIYGSELVANLRPLGIKVRVESDLQDLLTEPAVKTLVGFLQLAVRPKAPAEWKQTVSLLMELRGYHPDTPHDKLTRLETELKQFIERLRHQLVDIDPTTGAEADLCACFGDIFDFVDTTAFKKVFPQYSQGTLFDRSVKNAAEHLWDYRVKEGEWGAALDGFVGVDTIPIMTIHKSKGLEYDTVVFLGLEDGAFWSFRGQEYEDTCSFFVAFSRAKRRVFFTFSEVRNSGRGGNVARESNRNIRTLYELLKRAAVPIVDKRR